jgi:hypothetical protein
MQDVLRTLRQINISPRDIGMALVVIGVAFFFPLFVLPETGSLIGATTAIFSIVAGFFIADATGNYLRLQTLIAEENAALISIAHTARNIPESREKITECVDGYMVSQLDVDNLDHLVSIANEFESLISALDEAVIAPSAVKLGISESLSEEKDHLIALNQEITLAAQSNLTPVHWSVLLTLGALVAITVLAIRDGSILMNIVTSAVLLGGFGILIVLRDVDNNKYLQTKLAFRNPQQVFRALELAPYYPPFAPKKLRVPGVEGKYRTRESNGKIVFIAT